MLYKCYSTSGSINTTNSESMAMKEILLPMAKRLGFTEVHEILTHQSSVILPTSDNWYPGYYSNILYFLNFTYPRNFARYTLYQSKLFREINLDGDIITINLGTSDGFKISTDPRPVSRSISPTTIPKSFFEKIYTPQEEEVEEEEEAPKVRFLHNVIVDSNGTPLALWIKGNILMVLFDIKHDIRRGSSRQKVAERILLFMEEQIKNNTVPEWKFYCAKKSEERIDISKYFALQDLPEFSGDDIKRLLDRFHTSKIRKVENNLKNSQNSIEYLKADIETTKARIVQYEKDIIEMKKIDMTEKAHGVCESIKRIPGILDVCMSGNLIKLLTSDDCLHLGPMTYPNMVIEIDMSNGYFSFYGIANGLKPLKDSAIHPHKSGHSGFCLGNLNGAFGRSVRDRNYGMAITQIFLALRTAYPQSGYRSYKNVLNCWKNNGYNLPGVDEMLEVLGRNTYTRYINQNRDTLVEHPSKDEVKIINGARVFVTTRTSKLLPQLRSGSMRIDLLDSLTPPRGET